MIVALQRSLIAALDESAAAVRDVVSVLSQ